MCSRQVERALLRQHLERAHRVVVPVQDPDLQGAAGAPQRLADLADLDVPPRRQPPPDREPVQLLPRLYDHAGGDLRDRLPSGDEVSALDSLVSVVDAGRHAARIGLDVLQRPHDLLVIVAPRTPLGVADATSLMSSVDERTGTQGRRRTVLVLNAPFGPVRDASTIDALRSTFEHRGVHALPRDPALAIGGRIATSRLARPTRRAAHELAVHVADLVARHRTGVGG
jgi:hypothetical protein